MKITGKISLFFACIYVFWHKNFLPQKKNIFPLASFDIFFIFYILTITPKFKTPVKVMSIEPHGHPQLSCMQARYLKISKPYLKENLEEKQGHQSLTDPLSQPWSETKVKLIIVIFNRMQQIQSKYRQYKQVQFNYCSRKGNIC